VEFFNKDDVGAKNKAIKRPTDPNYLYKATIISVVDGDTLLLDVDLGFKVFKKQRVRLTQINAKEMSTKEGQKAFEYLQNLAANLEIIAIKTNKIDIYGRYLADIFYLPREVNNQTTQIDIFNDGIYLNQELVDKDLVDLF
jgi:endonuclease YncB( thermonuclease family)